MRGNTWAGVVACALFICACCPATAHQEVDPAILGLVKPRTGAPPGSIARPPGDPLVEKGRRLFFAETFGGNGRTCGTCHRAERNFTIDAAFIRRLPKTDPLFVAETNPALAGLEHPALLRRLGLILENLDGFDQPGVLRGVPHTLGLRFSSGSAAGVPLAGALGWSGDGAPGDGTLRQFAVGAVVQHFPKTLARRAGADFRVPTQDELDALLAFQLSLGRQAELKVDPQDPQALTFRDAAVAEGQRLFHAAPARGGSTRSCAGCHSNAGATTRSGNGLNTDTGVRSLANAPACLDPKVPGDGGFASEPARTARLCGREVIFRGNGQFNTPSLVEAADTPPFFHNNAAATIEDAVRFYASDVFDASPAGGGRAFVLDRAQVDQLAGFLRAINALDNIANARRSLEGAIGRPSLSRVLKGPAVVDINDAIEVLTRGPIKLFASSQPTESLLAARVNIGRGRLAQATVDLDRARGLMVGAP
jgi:cytochrome c peroxidase